MRQNVRMVPMTTRITSADLFMLERAVSKFMGTEVGEVFALTPGTFAFVASAGPEVHGWCWGYHLVRPDGTSMLYLHQLEVDESHRRKGIGRELLRAFMDAGVQAGATKMFLTAGAGNTPARSLYESMGGGLASQGPTVNYWFMLSEALGRGSEGWAAP
jgi:ribosomal protein S18 acetylase RimI-like enzyme